MKRSISDSSLATRYFKIGMHRRTFLRLFATGIAAAALRYSPIVYSKTYLTVDQAREILWGDMPMTKQFITLTKEQMRNIRKASRVRVRNKQLKAWKTQNGGWFIVDQVIGKHENIDLAIALDPTGSVKGIEILVYRETYGHQIRNAKWRAFFHGKDYTARLRLDQQIPNISGATLSCRHVTDGVNRITQTWHQVLRAL